MTEPLKMPWVPGDKAQWSSGEYFRAYVDSRHFTQAEIATVMEMTRETINRWYRLRWPVSRDNLRHLRIMTRALEANTVVDYVRFPELYKRRRSHRGKYSVAVLDGKLISIENPNPSYLYERNPLVHPGQGAVILDLFKDKPDVTVTWETA